MKVLLNISALLICTLWIYGCGSKPGDNDSRAEFNPVFADSLNAPQVEFYETEHDFGRVYEGENAGWFFKFKNTGSKPLIIKKAQGSCGCTVPEFSTEPVMPGKEGEIRVVFNTIGRTGRQSKTITVETNAVNNSEILLIKAEIIKNE